MNRKVNSKSPPDYNKYIYLNNIMKQISMRYELFLNIIINESGNIIKKKIIDYNFEIKRMCLDKQIIFFRLRKTFNISPSKYLVYICQKLLDFNKTRIINSTNEFQS